MFSKFFTVQEVANLFRLNTLTIYEYVRTGRLPAVKFGRNYRILEADLKTFIKEHKLYAK